jgi:beta-glucosidase
VTELVDAQPLRQSSVADLAARFPPEFVFGVASSAYQIEGAVNEDGRGPSIWDAFTHLPGRTANGETGDVACDHYHRWVEDLDLMQELGVDAYRFSVSWPRVLPEGIGQVNQRGLDFYGRLVDGLLERGIRPVLTLYHWDLPLALQERGGWTSPSAAEWFGEYAGVLVDRLGDRVETWVTLNEPQVFAFTGHARGVHAPGITDWRTGLLVAHAALAAHGVAASRIREAPRARIGVALDINLVEPATDSQEDRLAALRHRALQQDWFLGPLFGRGYPELALRAHREAGHLNGLPLVAPTTDVLDFIGLNYYNREVVRADASLPFGYSLAGPMGVPRTAMGWEVHPDGLRRVLRWLHETYAPPAIVVTENGAAFPDREPPDGQTVDDFPRRAYLAGHVAAAAQALAEGVPLTGYFAWSLLDNFEWAMGYSQRFGIVRVDYTTQHRSLKASGEWYRSLLAARHASWASPLG